MSILAKLLVAVGADVTGFKEAMDSVTGGLDAVGKSSKVTDEQLKQFGKGTQDLVERQQRFDARLEKARQTLTEVQKKVREGILDHRALERAVADVQRAQDRANISFRQGTGISGQLAAGLNQVRFAGLGLGDVLAGGVKFAGIGATIYEAGKVVYQASEVFESARVRIERDTGATGAALESLQKSFRGLYGGSAQPGDVVAGALSQVAIRNRTTGPEAGEATRSQLQFAKVTGSDPSIIKENLRLFEQFNIALKDQGTALDVLNVARQKSGMSAQQLVSSILSVGPVLRNFRFNFEESTALIASFDRAGLDATEMVQGLGRSFTKWKQAGEDPRKMLELLLERMSQAKTRAEAVGIAISEGFSGKGATIEKFADAVQKGAFAFHDLIGDLDHAKGSVEAMAQDTETLADNWERLKHTLEGDIEQSGLIKGLTNLLGKLDDFAAKHPGFLGGRAVSIVPGIGPFLEGLVRATSPAPPPDLAEAGKRGKGIIDAVLAHLGTAPKDIGDRDIASTQAEEVAIAIRTFKTSVEELHEKLTRGRIGWEEYAAGVKKASDTLRDAAGAAGQLTGFLATQEATQVGLNAEFKGSALLLQEIGALWFQNGQHAAEYGAALQLVLSATTKLRAEEERKRAAADAAFAQKAQLGGVTEKEAAEAVARARSSNQTGLEFLQAQLQKSGVKLPPQVLADLVGRQGAADAAQQNQAQAQLAVQFQQLRESQRQHETGLLGEFGAGSGRGLQKLISDFAELNEAYRQGRVSLQELTEAQSGFFSRMEEEAEKPALRQAIRMFEQGLIGSDELLKARNRARAGDKRRGVEDAFMSGRASEVDLLNANQEYRYDLNSNRATPKVPNTLMLPNGMQIPDMSVPRMSVPDLSPFQGGGGGGAASAMPPIQIQLILDSRVVSEAVIRDLKDRGVNA